jgi:hypothetical protein
MATVKINKDQRERLFQSLERHLVEILSMYHWQIFCADDQVEKGDHYEHLRRGGCMLCGEPLGEDTIVFVDAQGILALFCGAECAQDMHVIPYLNELIEGKLARLMPEEE